MSKHPLWLVGFRPFFALACLSGVVLPLFWALMFAGALEAPTAAFTGIQWHAHEMFFGFGWAMLAGFLLTASKNWVKIRGYHGAPLVFLVAAWCLDRLGMAFGAGWPPALFQISNQLFLVAVVAMLVWTLLRHRETDGYRRDNVFFLLLLPLFPVAKFLLLDGHWSQAGELMALGLFRLAFLIMLERTLTDFMKNVFKAEILRRPALDVPIKSLALALAFAGFLPPPLQGGLALLLAALLIGRFAFWHPARGFSRLDIAVMYLGYLAIVLQLLVVAFEQLAQVVWVGSVTIHLFTFGAMGLIMPAMIVRIAKGHTGRKVAFDRVDKAVLWLMIAALALRVVAPQLAPGAYLAWVSLAAAGWSLAFAILAWRVIPFLLAPRVDGRDH
ncbi:MAG: NnrS family protein [Rhodocyclaceae bacterium]|nr:NnrS family protein [Rhodocyclaceae bacterium]MCC6879646.1 NnrS family protein [Rhodocyclaceae bacterium]